MNIEIKKSEKPIKYDDAIKFMETRLLDIHENDSKELVWILEHKDIYTAGTNFKESEILDNLLPRNISTQIFKAMLENAASEQGSRMTAMDSATRNAGDLVDKLTITYNRSRQAAITKELIEIISGAESL